MEEFGLLIPSRYLVIFAPTAMLSAKEVTLTLDSDLKTNYTMPFNWGIPKIPQSDADLRVIVAREDLATLRYHQTSLTGDTLYRLIQLGCGRQRRAFCEEVTTLFHQKNLGKFLRLCMDPDRSFLEIENALLSCYGQTKLVLDNVVVTCDNGVASYYITLGRILSRLFGNGSYQHLGESFYRFPVEERLRYFELFCEIEGRGKIGWGEQCTSIASSIVQKDDQLIDIARRHGAVSFLKHYDDRIRREEHRRVNRLLLHEKESNRLEGKLFLDGILERFFPDPTISTSIPGQPDQIDDLGGKNSWHAVRLAGHGSRVQQGDVDATFTRILGPTDGPIGTIRMSAS